MDARAIITKLRNRQPMDDDEIRWIARGIADGTVSDAQAGAFAMAVVLNGLSEDERIALTREMRDSGRVLSWDLDGPVLDKHSTGGVGDCVSLVLGPALAACGAYVPMISGRGLGHTGGTLDKLEAIPGYSADVSVSRLRAVTAQVGCAIVGASHDIAPADKRLYAIRDVTATVESLDLITASILSKKLAAGLEGLVLDVKAGSGAFVKTVDQAVALADALVRTAQGAGCMTSALITDMDQPLVPSAGNALEVIEVMGTLTGRDVNPRLHEISCALGGELLALGGLAATAEDGAGRIDAVLGNGAAADVFGDMVAELGGPLDFVERWPDRLPSAPVVREVRAGRSGVIGAIDCQMLGLAVVELGGGRKRDGDRINPSVGLSGLAGLGEAMTPDMPIGRIHAANEDAADLAEQLLRKAYVLAEEGGETPPLILRSIR